MKSTQCKKAQDLIIKHIDDMSTLLKRHIDLNNESPHFFDEGDKLLKKAHKVISSKSKEDFQEFNAQFREC